MNHNEQPMNDLATRLAQAIRTNTLVGFLRNRAKEGQYIDEWPRQWMTEEQWDSVDLAALRRLADECYERQRQECIAGKKREFLEPHCRKRIPGLQALLRSDLEDWQRSLVEQRIADLRQRHDEAVAEQMRKAQQEKLLTEKRAELCEMDLPTLLGMQHPDSDVMDVRNSFIKQSATTVASMAAESEVSETTVRLSLGRLGIRPCFTDNYTTGSGSWRKDVTAHYYFPSVTKLVADELSNRAEDRETELQRNRVRRMAERENKKYYKQTGFSKPL